MDQQSKSIENYSEIYSNQRKFTIQEIINKFGYPDNSSILWNFFNKDLNVSFNFIQLLEYALTNTSEKNIASSTSLGLVKEYFENHFPDHIIDNYVPLTDNEKIYIRSRGGTWNITTNIDHNNGVINNIDVKHITIRDILDYLKN